MPPLQKRVVGVGIPGATKLLVEFDPQCSTEARCDYLIFFADKDKRKKIHEPFHGSYSPRSWPACEIDGHEFWSRRALALTVTFSVRGCRKPVNFGC